MMLWWLRVFLRFLQAACCLVALITVSSGFVVTSYYGYTSMLGSSPVTYTQLMTYMGFLYALFLLVLSDLLGLIARPFWLFELGMDFVMAVLLLIAAIVLLVSDYVMNCSVYGIMLRCRSLNTAVVFTFLAMAAFILSMLVNFCMTDRDNNGNNTGSGTHVDEESGMYRAEATPTAQGSPKSPMTRA